MTLFNRIFTFFMKKNLILKLFPFLWMSEYLLLLNLFMIPSLTQAWQVL